MALCGCATDDVVQPDGGGCDVLFVGLEGAGKSLLLRQLQQLHRKGDRDRDKADAGGHIALDPVPTIGTQIVEVLCPKGAKVKRLVVREVGGQMLQLWPQYFSECRAAALVVDAANAGQLAQATTELWALLRAKELQDKSLCVVLNKLDLPVTVPRPEIELVMGLSDLVSSLGDTRLVVCDASAAVGGPGLAPLLQWMIQAAVQRQQQVQVQVQAGSPLPPATAVTA